MKEFLLIFRSSPVTSEVPLSPEQIQARMKPWQDWMGSLAAQNKLSSAGNRLESATGRQIKPNHVVTNGPYVETKELVSGYTILKADSLDEATELAKGCPILKMGGNIEVRAIVPM